MGAIDARRLLGTLRDPAGERGQGVRSPFPVSTAGKSSTNRHVAERPSSGGLRGAAPRRGSPSDQEAEPAFSRARVRAALRALALRSAAVWRRAVVLAWRDRAACEA